MYGLVFPIATYDFGTWAVGRMDRSKIQAFDIWCWRNMLRISWKEKGTNKSKVKYETTPPYARRFTETNFNTLARCQEEMVIV